MEEREYSNIYAIPANYTDSGGVFGGMLNTRNTIETCFLLLLFGYPQLMWFSLPIGTTVVVMIVTLLPVGVIGLMGIGGDSLMQHIAHMVKFLIRRRKLHFKRIGYHYDNKTNIPAWGRKKEPRPH